MFGFIFNSAIDNYIHFREQLSYCSLEIIILLQLLIIIGINKSIY